MTNSAHSAVVVQAEEGAGAALAADRRRWAEPGSYHRRHRHHKR